MKSIKKSIDYFFVSSSEKESCANVIVVEMSNET